MNRSILLLMMFFARTGILAQAPAGDSLLNLLKYEKTDSGKVSILNSLSRHHTRQFEITEAMNYAEQAKALATKARYQKGIREAFISMAGIYNARANNFMSKHRYPEGLNFYLQALKIYEKYDYKPGLSGVNMNIGRLYSEQGDFGLAAAYYEKAINIARKNNDWNGIANLSNNIGVELMNQRHFDKALNYFEESINAHNKTGNKNGLINVYFNIGFHYEDQHKYEDALKNHQTALRISEEVVSDGGIAASYANMGDIYKKTRQYEDALKCYRKSLDIYKEMESNDGISMMHSDLGTVYFLVKDFSNAKMHLEQGLKLALADGYLYHIQLIYEKLARVDSASGDWESAFHHYRSFITYRDSMNGEEVDNKILKAQMQYQSEKEKDSLRYLNQLGDERLKREILLGIKQKQELLLRENELALLNRENRLRMLQLQNDSIQFAAHKTMTEKKQDEFLLLNQEKAIQSLQLQKQKQMKGYLLAAMALLLLGGFFAYRNYYNRQRLKLQTLRNKIASDLHDDIGSTLSSISIFSQMAQKQSKDVQPLLESIEENSRKMLDAMADIVWTVNSDNDQFEKMILRMRSFAYELLGAKEIDFEFQAEEEVSGVRLPMNVRRNLYLIFKEATNNLAKYSRANKAIFNIKEEKKNLVMQIIDNGQGFDVSKPTFGNGLKNMKKRAEEIGASIRIESNPGKGTLIELKMAV